MPAVGNTYEAFWNGDLSEFQNVEFANIPCLQAKLKDLEANCPNIYIYITSLHPK
jgi:hypothetical protein